MSKKTKVKTSCDNCNKEIEVKLSQLNRSVKHYCSNKCRYAGRTKEVDLLKDKIIFLYNTGLTAFEVAQKLGIEPPRLYYHLKKWKLGIKKCSTYTKIMQNIGKKRKAKTEKDFLGRYKRGEISWRHTHDIASRVWGITKIPCEVCGWEEAERDMHLIVPRLLLRSNAASLCPNHHRLFHRGKIKLQRKNKKLIVVKI